MSFKGEVEWFDNKKGYGLIIPDNNNDYTKVDKKIFDCITETNKVFIHHSEIKTNSKSRKCLYDEEKLIFDIEYDGQKNKIYAINIKPANGKFKFEHQNSNIQIKDNHKKQRQHSRVKNTVNFNPSHEPTDMRIVYQHGGKKLSKHITSRDILIIDGLFKHQIEEGEIYKNLIDELKNTGLKESDLFKEWHGNSHLIADDHLKWKNDCPTFMMVLNVIKEFFNMDIQATRLNLYENSDDWKPYHHDAAAIKKDKADKQNFTVGVSFGLEREASFEHAKTGTTVSLPLPDGSIYVFTKDVNVMWRHGILQMPPEKKSNKGRISIIAWGWCDQEQV